MDGSSRCCVIEHAPDAGSRRQARYLRGNLIEELIGISRVVSARRAVKTVIDELRVASGLGGRRDARRVGSRSRDAKFREQRVGDFTEPGAVTWLAGYVAVVQVTKPG
jgi:hypothetical protein